MKRYGWNHCMPANAVKPVRFVFAYDYTPFREKL